MALKRPRWPAGTVVVLEHHSNVLRENALGDPHVRRLAVWLPAEYDEGATRGRGRRFPVFVDLVGFTGSGLSHVAWKNFSENVPERAARLIHEHTMGPTILVFPDCFTALGGNQYVNSPAIGDYADYLTRELIPYVDREFRTLASRDHRGCSGKYNALRESRRKGLAEGRDDGRVKRFLEHIWKTEKLSSGEGHAIMNLCMAATYDPDPRAPLGFRLPFNLESGEVIPARWKHWLAN